MLTQELYLDKLIISVGKISFIGKHLKGIRNIKRRRKKHVHEQSYYCWSFGS